ncbi:RDD family protein [Xanthomonas maliensis]|uniref:RDD family protein n=1 Tax=Xanthomonas maliensis TaxID=1321368 RepID=UPI0003A9323A|nr:RDD family protein [Xanthomonas maliensis]KAB7762488.1 hypothetical protein CKY51_21305 [Xanthomonas maliensis]
MEQRWQIQHENGILHATRAQAQAWHAAGRIGSQSLVWTAGMSSWQPYANCSLATPVPPPLPDAINANDAAEPALPPPEAPSLELRRRDGRIEPRFVAGEVRASLERPALAVPADAPALHVYGDGWQDVRPHPWRRYFARGFDTLLLGGLLWFGLGIVAGTVSPALYTALLLPVSQHLLLSTLATMVLVMPLLALWIGLSGTSPGKWLFGIRVLRSDGFPLGFTDALLREGRVLLYGQCLGLPLLSIAAQVYALVSLFNHGQCSWDRDHGWVVTHRPFGATQVVFGVLALLLLGSMLAVLRWMG